MQLPKEQAKEGNYLLIAVVTCTVYQIEANVILVLEEEANKAVDATSKLSPEELVFARQLVVMFSTMIVYGNHV